MRFGASIRGALAPAVTMLQTRAGALDRWIARGRRFVVGESCGIVVPVFHAVLPPGVEARGLDPAYAITIDQLAEALDYFVGRAFTPIGLPQLLAGLDPGRNYVMFTFDDGYANNLAAIDMLERAGVPSMLSVNLDILRSGESFWWDVLYRELHRRGVPVTEIARERQRLMDVEPASIRAELVSRFGESALRPCDEHDRPLTIDELRALAARPAISLANHTSDHRSLVGGDRAAIMASLRDTQRDLAELSGTTPLAVTYPYGQYDESAIDSCRALGFDVGFTGEFGKARLPEGLRGRARMRLPRCVIFSDRPIAGQCESTHVDWRPSWTIRRWVRRMHGNGIPRMMAP